MREPLSSATFVSDGTFRPAGGRSTLDAPIVFVFLEPALFFIGIGLIFASEDCNGAGLTLTARVLTGFSYF